MLYAPLPVGVCLNIIVALWTLKENKSQTQQETQTNKQNPPPALNSPTHTWRSHLKSWVGNPALRSIFSLTAYMYRKKQDPHSVNPHAREAIPLHRMGLHYASCIGWGEAAVGSQISAAQPPPSISYPILRSPQSGLTSRPALLLVARLQRHV